MKSIHRMTWTIVAAMALCGPVAWAQTSEDELREQQEKQRRVQAETNEIVRRITTMLRIRQFYGINSPNRDALQEMAGTLNQLSKEQMAEVIRQLEKAADANSAKLSDKADEALEKAHQNHRKVLDSLHEMMSRFDAVKSLDQAADRFEKYARAELDLHLQTGQAIRDLADSDRPDISQTRKLFLDKRMQIGRASCRERV